MAESDKTIKDLQAELDEIVTWFESDEISIDEVAVKYEKANELVKQIEHKLTETENKITKITAKFS